MEWPLHKRGRMKKSSHAQPFTSQPFTYKNRNVVKLDESTGQVYLESTVSLRESDDLGWTSDVAELDRALGRNETVSDDDSRGGDVNQHGSKLRGIFISGEMKFRRLIGARSLQEAALESLLDNISDVTAEAIECLPISIVRRLWGLVNERFSKSFNNWRIFAKILREDGASSMQVFRYHQQIKAPNASLEVYTNPLKSELFDFITSLSIVVEVPVPDLIKLSGIKNLGVLEIVNPFGNEHTSVGDRLMRTWALAASDEGAFPVLRILKLWGHAELTDRSLVFLNSFPALGLYDVDGCDFSLDVKVEATRLGWRAIRESDALGFLEKTCEKRVDTMRTRLGLELDPPHTHHRGRIWRGSRIQHVPRVEISTLLVQRRLGKDLPELGLEDQPDRQFWRRQFIEAWDVKSYKAFARIGELRNDTDLARAGIVLGDQAVVEDQLVNSTPIASLRLGEHTPRESCESLAFIRIKIPLTTGREDSNSQKAFPGNTPHVPSNAPPPAQERLSKRHSSSISRKRKRKLDDVLGSFS